MKVRDIMTTGVAVIEPDATLEEAAEKMKAHDVGPLPVCENDQLIGMVTDRDITILGTAEGRNPQETTVRDVMTPEVFYVQENQDVEEATRLMEQHQVRRLPVVNESKKLVGIVGLADVANKTEDDFEAAHVTQSVATPKSESGNG
jgi:CBS domain-containing protein